MDYLLLFSIFVLFKGSWAVKQSDCNLPNEALGECISLQQCPAILSSMFVNNTAFIERLQCGMEGETLKVCCPLGNKCYTPEDEIGTCNSVYRCPHLIKLLQPEYLPVSRETIRYLQESKAACTKRNQASRSRDEVCCGPPPNTTVGSCDISVVSALPVNPDSKCCGRDANSNKGSEEQADITRHPWLALIEYEKKETEEFVSLCRGVLISTRYILTAGHCLEGRILDIGTPKRVRLGYQEPKGINCILGEDKHKSCNNSEMTMDILHTYKPGTSKKHDIGIIELRQKAPYTDHIRPICLPKIDITLSPNPNVTLIALGWSSNGNRSSSDVKQSTLSLVSPDECLQSFNSSNKNVTLREGTFCAGVLESTTKENMGDILLSLNEGNFEIIGFNAVPSANGDANLPGVYTNVFREIEEIRSIIYDSILNSRHPWREGYGIPNRDRKFEIPRN